ncbi:tetratricopeptide repeat protein [Streptomyces sp. NRRL F-5123]|uniref:tetratricopeptide repeat protein n=1 Tax=Streptomyces sp. NRRL F-5123 TaxID=1463856 RepID=UPI000694AC58|nr:tetratricopeptide repeat protein [Streptomyces sp. NRRL F-5123]
MPARAGAFQDRTERARLRAAVDGGDTAVLCQVLSGLGGVGKTQLAAEYAHEVWTAGEVDLLVWVNADSRSAVVATFAEAAAEVCGADPGHPDRAAERFLSWLQSEGRRWLVVLDDLADPADLTGLWPPAAPYGRTVVTTRRRDAALTGAGRRRIDVGVFTPDEATAYLAAALAAHDITEPDTELAGLASDLGHLPLALSQATAYVVDAGLPVAAYRALLAERTARLDELSPDVLPDGQTRTTAAAWELSVEYADRLRPAGLARPMLELAAFLDAHGIPVEVLTSGPARAYLAARTDRADVTPAEASGALRALHRLSLVQAPEPGDAAEHPAIRLHQLVQRATRDALPAGRFGRAARAAGDALVDVWPRFERDTAFARTLRGCAAALEAYARHTGCLYRPGVHAALYLAGYSLLESGQVAAAAARLRVMVDSATEYLGPDHVDTLAARNNLAKTQGAAGDVTTAARSTARLLADVTRLLGPDHRGTLATRSNLIHFQREAGDPAGAAAGYRDLLRVMTRALGPDDPDTLTARGHLARCLGEAGDAAAAVAAYTELLADVTRVLGPDDPETFAARGNLARFQGETGNVTAAATGYAGLLPDVIRVLGPDHPTALTTRGNLARWQGAAGDAAAAVAAYTELLADMTRVLGPDHPHTLAALGNIADRVGRMGNPAAAAAAYARLAEDTRRVLGPGHPDSLLVRGHAAFWLGAGGDPRGAAAGFAGLLDDITRALGPDHPHARAARGNLAFWRQRAAEDPSSSA